MKSVNERGDTSPQLQNNAAGESKKSPSTDKRGNTSSQNKSGDSSPQNQRGGNPPQKKHGGNPPQKRRHTFRKPGRYKPMSDQKSGTGQQPKLQGAPAPQPTSGKGFPLRMYPLGGFEQVGRNCFVLEVDNDIYIIDLGLQFPDEGMLGIDYLIPDISALRGRENRIKGILFTHGHLDHIGAAQHLLPKLHYPPCYGTKLTMAFIKKRLDEEKITSKANLNVVNYGEKIRLGKVEVEFLKVTHSIPDSAAIAIHTPYGTIVHTGDFKFDLTPMNEPPADFHRLAQQSEKGVLAIIADSTNANRPGHSKSEAEISEALFNLFRDANGRIIISTFSSLLNRLQQIIDHAQKLNRKVFISGRSMETNIEIAQNLGYIKAPRGVIRKVGPGMDKIPDKEVIIMTTGSQGDRKSVV